MALSKIPLLVEVFSHDFQILEATGVDQGIGVLESDPDLVFEGLFTL